MNPYDDIRRFEKMMQKMMEGLFGGGHVEFFGPTRAKRPGVREPLTDINETKDQVIVTMELPGASKRDINLEVTSQGIEISAKTKKIMEEGNISESSFTQFKKYMTLPVEVDPDSVDARYKNGILEVKLNKLEPSESKKVKIK